MRKIIQIAATGSPHGADNVYALCDDGSLWELHNATHHYWRELPPIPGTPRDREAVRDA